MPAGVAQLAPGYRALFERARNVFSADPRVRALWVGGSVARGEADAYSDLDLVVTVSDADFDAFAAGWREWLAAITPTVLARAIPFLPGSLYSLTPSCERLDVVVERVSALRASRYTRALVFDRRPRSERPTPPAPASPGKTKSRSRRAPRLSRSCPQRSGAASAYCPKGGDGRAQAHLGAVPPKRGTRRPPPPG